MNSGAPASLDASSKSLLMTMQALGIPLSVDDRSTRVAAARSNSRASLAPLYSVYSTREQGPSRSVFGPSTFVTGADIESSGIGSGVGAGSSTVGTMLAEAATRHVLPSAAPLMYPLLSHPDTTAMRQRNARIFTSGFSAGALAGSSFGPPTGDERRAAAVEFLPSVGVEDAQESLTRLTPQAQQLFSVIEDADKFAVLTTLLESGQSSAADLLSLAALDRLPSEALTLGGGGDAQRFAFGGDETGDGSDPTGKQPAAQSKTDKVVQFLLESGSDSDNSDEGGGDAAAAAARPRGKAPPPKRKAAGGSRSSKVLQEAMRDFSASTAAAATGGGGGGAAVPPSSEVGAEIGREMFMDRAAAKEIEQRREMERQMRRQQDKQAMRRRGREE